jgi:uncharacterized membrane protein
MRNDYELLHPVLAIVSVGLIAYLVYLISLMVMGSAMRILENVILVLVVIATLIIIIFIVREETRLHEKLNRVLSGAGKPREKEALKPPIQEESREEIRRALRKDILEEEKPARKPGAGKEKVEDIRRLLRLGTELAGTDIEKAKEAYDQARKIYEPLSEEEKKLISKETIMMMKLYKKLEEKR